MKRVLVTLCTVVVLIWSNLGLASAWNANIDGLLPEGGVRFYGTHRIVNTPPWEIAAQRIGGSSGPLELMYYPCGTIGYRDVGDFKLVNYGEYTWLREDVGGYIEFCIGARGSGNSSFSANLDWDYDPAPRQPLSVGN